MDNLNERGPLSQRTQNDQQLRRYRRSVLYFCLLALLQYRE